MIRWSIELKKRLVLSSVGLFVLSSLVAPPRAQVLTNKPLTFAFVNGQWFNDKGFSARTVYSVAGTFTFRKPSRVDRTLDLAGTWVVPPFGEAHNHNIGLGVESMDRQAIQRYLADGVFYVKSQGNLPLTDAMKTHLGVNRPDSIDIVLAQGSLTATGAHPEVLVGELLGRGLFPGYTKETLRDFRYFAIDSQADLDRKWSAILALKPDFIKTFLWRSGEFDKRKDDAAVGFQKGLDPRLLPKIVERAHANNLRVSAHIVDAADFHNAVVAGVDEIAHIPQLDVAPIAAEDARLAATRRIVVDTTLLAPLTALVQERVVREPDVPAIRRAQVANLKSLYESGVRLAIGSDSVVDSSVRELFYLKELDVFDNLTLLKMWAETTPQSIFPKRKIGALSHGAEASFLALEGNPLEDLKNVRRIRVRFKQGFVLEGPQH
jgi:hypothetical protein